MKKQAILLTVLGAAFLLSPLLGTASAASTATVTLRVAPEGFVVPSRTYCVISPLPPGFVCAPTPIPPSSIWIVDPATVTTFNDQDGIAGCTLTVNDANGNGRVDGGEVLDTATTTGCISGWDSQDFGFGRFVTSVDGRDELGWPATWWNLQVNSHESPVGIDDMDLVDGDSLEFVYVVGP